MKQITILTIVIYLCLSSQVLGSDKAVIGEGYLIKTSEAAVQRASALSGIDLVAGDGKSQPMYKSELVIYVDSTSPFLSEMLNGRTAWKVDIENVSLSDLIDTVEKKGTHPVDVSITVDAENGKLLSIRITVKNISVKKIVEVPARIAAAQLNMMGEKYLGLGKGDSKLSFMQVLQKDNRQSSHLLNAAVIIGHYLEYSNIGLTSFGLEPKSIWIVEFQGTRTILSNSHWRNIVDAESGKVIWGMNSPFLSSDSDKVIWEKALDR